MTNTPWTSPFTSDGNKPPDGFGIVENPPVTPNNIAGEEWRQELWKYRNVGLDPHMIPSLERLIEKTRQEAITGERERIKEIMWSVQAFPPADNYRDTVIEKIEAITPTPDTSTK